MDKFYELRNFMNAWSQQQEQEEELHESSVNRLYECKPVKNRVSSHNLLVRVSLSVFPVGVAYSREIGFKRGTDLLILSRNIIVNMQWEIQIGSYFQYAFKLTYFKHNEIIKGFEFPAAYLPICFSSNYASLLPP